MEGPVSVRVAGEWVSVAVVPSVRVVQLPCPRGLGFIFPTWVTGAFAPCQGGTFREEVEGRNLVPMDNLSFLS